MHCPAGGQNIHEQTYFFEVFMEAGGRLVPGGLGVGAPRECALGTIHVLGQIRWLMGMPTPQISKFIQLFMKHLSNLGFNPLTYVLND